MSFSKRTKRFCSFLLTAEEKEPKKTATPSPFKGDVTDYGQRPPCVRVLVSLSSLCPSGVRDEFFIGWRSDNEANINNLRPCLNTEGYGGEEPPENRKCTNRFQYGWVGSDGGWRRTKVGMIIADVGLGQSASRGNHQ